ncbi:MAG: M1 family metallopeptidase [Lewinellaceae bacterium]|nr:M1 family metallopeptidase [Lewinellaceae bacterium]
MPRLLTILSVIAFSANVLILTAQPALYVARDFQQAVQKNTRTMNGRPGADYWQNRALYELDVTVNPRDKKVEGKARITYTNNSADALQRLNLKLVQNVHLARAVRAYQIGEDFLTDGIHLRNVRIDGKAVAWDNQAVQASDDPTNAWLNLPKALEPGSSADIELEWSYTLQTSSGEHREGMVDSTSLYCAYWYPRIAVYDDIRGWDLIPHNVQTEFYNDFSDYDVTVRVPEGFIVWATGELANARELLNEPYLGRLQQSYQSDEVIHVVAADDLKKGGITLRKPQPAWHFRASDVTDFAFGLSDHYLWDATSVVADPSTGRRASVQTAYQKQSADFPEVADIARNCIAYFSTQMPAIPYPYPKLTVFNGFGQMEYPMMVNDVDMSSLDDSKALTAHEIAHTYFPFLTGINETAFAWMDEGWATFLEYFACTELYTLKHPEQAIYPGYYLNRYLAQNGPEAETPIFTPSFQLLNPAYGLNSYGKPASAYLSLMYLLGREQFLECLQAYVERWRGKHPQPYDFFFTFQEVSGQDLGWFWQRWFMEFNTMSLALADYHYDNGISYVRVRNKGGKPLPIVLKATMEDGSNQTFTFSPAWWEDREEVEVGFATSGPAARVELVWKEFVDVDRSDDIFIKPRGF